MDPLTEIIIETFGPIWLILGIVITILGFVSSDSISILFFIIGIPSLIIGVYGLLLNLKSRKNDLEQERLKKEQHDNTMQQYKDGTWEFPVNKFFASCKENKIEDINNSFSLEKAKLLAKTIINQENIPIPEEYQHRYLDSTFLKNCFEKGKQEAEKQAAIEKHNKEVWNSTPHTATPNPEEKKQLDLAKNLVTKFGIEKRRTMLNFSINELDEQIRIKREGQEAMKTFSRAFAVSAYQEKKSDWAFLGGMADAIAGPGAGMAVAASTMAKNAEIDRRNEANRAAVNQLSYDLLKSANDLDASIDDMIKAKELLQNEVSLLDQKVRLTEVGTSELWKKIKVSKKSVTKNDTNVLTITTEIKNDYIANVPENVRITLDGILSAKLYRGETLVGTATIPLPLYGVECNKTESFTTLFDKYMEGNRTYKIIYEPICLWAIEL